MEMQGKVHKPNQGMLIVVLAVLTLATFYGFVQTQISAGIFEKSGLVRGWDFQQFFVAGQLANGKLYDLDTFQSAQRRQLPVDEQNLIFFPLYPPMTALLFQPLSSLSYLQALSIWWFICLVSYGIACWLMIKRIDPPYRNMILLIMAGFFPFFIAMRAGQLAPVLLLVAVVGLQLRSGLVLSLLSLKPQFAVGMAIYWLLKREWKLLGGMMMGLVIQLGLIVSLLGSGIIWEYLEMVPLYMRHADMYVFPDGWVHSMSGLTGRLPHLLMILIVSGTCALGGKKEWSQESSLSILFMLFFTPHLLLYDLLFLIIPIVGLVSNWRVSLMLVAASSALALPIWSFANVSLVSVLILGIVLHHHWPAVGVKRYAKVVSLDG